MDIRYELYKKQMSNKQSTVFLLLIFEGICGQFCYFMTCLPKILNKYLVYQC